MRSITVISGRDTVTVNTWAAGSSTALVGNDSDDVAVDDDVTDEEERDEDREEDDRWWPKNSENTGKDSDMLTLRSKLAAAPEAQ